MQMQAVKTVPETASRVANRSITQLPLQHALETRCAITCQTCDKVPDGGLTHTALELSGPLKRLWSVPRLTLLTMGSSHQTSRSKHQTLLQHSHPLHLPEFCGRNGSVLIAHQSFPHGSLRLLVSIAWRINLHDLRPSIDGKPCRGQAARTVNLSL